jgi:enoyl-CoA hydratase/carnithine racemase
VCRFGDVGREKAAMTKSSNLVLREDSGGVASLSLNRPQHGNSLSLETIDALFDHLMVLRQEKSIGVIVLRSIGKNIFCAGHDLREFSGEDDPEFFKTVSRCAPA